jgi:hypothetical protein
LKLSIAFGVCATSSRVFAQPDPQSESIEDEAVSRGAGADTTDEGEPAPPKPPPAAAKKKVQWLRGVIFNDGAAVYAKPDFDSPVQDYLDANSKILISRRPVQGLGGMGLFHMIRYGQKQGYVPDTDVRVNKAAAKTNAATKRKSPSKMWEDEEQEAMGDAPLYFRRYLGGAVAMVNFTEKFSGRRLSDNMTMYGLRMMGPGTLFDGPPLDFNFWFSLDKPSYYGRFSSGEPTGYLLFGDTAFMLPFIDGKEWLATYGIGMMWVYTSYRVPVKGRTFDSQEFRVGLDLTAGVSRRFGKYLLRGDIKYYYEKTQYLGYMLSFMGEY